MNINYEKIQQSINLYGRYVLDCIKNQYDTSLSDEQMHNINSLLNTDFIVIEKPSQKDIEFFSIQAGVIDPENYSSKYIPSAHGGRTKNDNKIHIYPYTNSFNKCKTDEEIVKLCMDSLVVHEIFHYFIRPSLPVENDNVKEEFGHFLTEGLVQYYAEELAKKYRLGTPKSNYGKNVEFAKQLISSFPSNLTQTQIDKIIFSSNQDELLNAAENGSLMYKEYVGEFNFKEKIASLIKDMGKDAKLEIGNELYDVLKYYRKIDDINVIFDNLSKNIDYIFKNNTELKSSYMFKLKNIISDRKLEKEISRYKLQIVNYLPIENKVNELKKTGMSFYDIKSFLGDDSYIFDYVPNILYHGSPESLDVINPNESTQKGSYVYATDNPVHALFFSIFRNSSVARANINEFIDKDGKYSVKYVIDERISGALEQIIKDEDITVHVCNGEQFCKPQGDSYINREWISRDGQGVVPIDKIHVNIKRFFKNLEEHCLVEYDRYDKSKDWKTVIDMLCLNYTFGLRTDKAKNIQEFDLIYDEFIKTNFPEQFEFSRKFREFVKTVMNTDYKFQNNNMTYEEEYNYKLRLIKGFSNKFLLFDTDKNGKSIWSVNIEMVNSFLDSNQIINEFKGRN